MRPTYKVTELLGDGIGAELSRAVHALAETLPIGLEFEPVEKQALLERDGVLERCRSLIELLEMKMLVARQQWGAGH